MRLNKKNFNVIGGHLKIQFLGGFKQNQYIGERELPKRGGLRQFADLREGMAKKRDDDADGVDNPMYTMSKVGGRGERDGGF